MTNGRAASVDPRDLVGLLEGSWTVSRELHDGDTRGRFAGIATFAREDDGLRWLEVGRVELGAHAGEARRALAIVPAGEAWEVRFEDGRPFHALDLRDGRCDATHLCGADVYTGEITLDGPDAFTIEWGVRGPAKEQRIASAYRRVVGTSPEV